jgi:hypothetical protein
MDRVSTPGRGFAAIGVTSVVMAPPGRALSLWSELPLLFKLFVMSLTVAAVALVSRLLLVLWRIRRIQKAANVGNPGDGCRALDRVALQIEGARQLLLFFSYLFPCCFFLQIPAAFITLDTNEPYSSILARQFGFYFNYAAYVCLALLILHISQWLVSSRLKSAHHRICS